MTTNSEILCGLDLETTGLDWTAGHRIIEVAALVYRGDGRKLGQFIQRINPMRAIDPKAQEIHHISFEHLVMCPAWETVSPKLHGVLSRCNKIVAHNGIGFDIPFLISEFDRVGLSTPSCLNHCVDTMIESRWATPMGKLPNLGELCFATGTEYDRSKAHGAEYDVEVMMASYFAAKKWGYFQDSADEKLAA